MGAALTVAVLLALSVIIVRIAAVAMRITGLPETVARFQCVSALTGTGFTTNEAEMIVNYPVRRRIVVTLMVLGNIGLVSIASTFIVAFVNTGAELRHIAVQAIVMLAAIAVTFVAATKRRLDRTMCAFIGRILEKASSLRVTGYRRILQLGDELSVAEHVYSGEPRSLGTIDLCGLTLIAIRSASTLRTRQIAESTVVEPGDTLVLSGSEAQHRAVAEPRRE